MGGVGWGGVIFCQDFKINYGIQCSKIVIKYIFNVTIKFDKRSLDVLYDGNHSAINVKCFLIKEMNFSKINSLS